MAMQCICRTRIATYTIYRQKMYAKDSFQIQRSQKGAKTVIGMKWFDPGTWSEGDRIERTSRRHMH